MFQYAYDQYMRHAWPASELLPISCQPGTFGLVQIPALTLIDALDTLFILFANNNDNQNNITEFARAVERIRSMMMMIQLLLRRTPNIHCLISIKMFPCLKPTYEYWKIIIGTSNCNQ